MIFWYAHGHFPVFQVNQCSSYQSNMGYCDTHAGKLNQVTYSSSFLQEEQRTGKVHQVREFMNRFSEFYYLKITRIGVVRECLH